MMLRSDPVPTFGGVKTGEVKMKYADWRESRRRTKHWITVGSGSSARGMGGTPSESEDRETNTNDWSGLSAVGGTGLTRKRPEWVVIPRRAEEQGPDALCGEREDQRRRDTRVDHVFLDVDDTQREHVAP